MKTVSDKVLVLTLKSVSSTVQHVVKLKPGTYIIGRDPGCDIVLPDPFVSRKHAKIFYSEEQGTWFIEDLGSKNGTYVNGEKIEKPTQIQEQTEIVVGLTTITVKELEPE